MRKSAPLWSCDFCRKSEHEVALLIAGPDYIAICNECVALCATIVAEKSTTPDVQHQQQTTEIRKD